MTEADLDQMHCHLQAWARRREPRFSQEYNYVRERRQAFEEDPTLPFTVSRYGLFFAAEILEPEEFQALWVDDPDWIGLLEHAGRAGILADIICVQMEIDKEQKLNIVKAALLHDAAKKKEVQKFNQLLTQTDVPQDVQILHVMRTTDFRLIELGIDETIRNMAGASIPMEEEVERLVQYEDQGLEDTDWMEIGRKIVWIVDAMLAGTNIVEISDRMRAAREDQELSDRDLRNSLIHAMKIGEYTLAQIQSMFADRICREFAKVDPIFTSPFYPEFLAMKVYERATSYDFNAAFDKFSYDLDLDILMSFTVQLGTLDAKYHGIANEVPDSV